METKEEIDKEYKDLTKKTDKLLLEVRDLFRKQNIGGFYDCEVTDKTGKLVR